MRRPETFGAANDFITAGLELHPKHAALHELLGDLMLKRGQKDAAVENFRKAYQLDPRVAKGVSLEEYVAARVKSN